MFVMLNFAILLHYFSWQIIQSNDGIGGPLSTASSGLGLFLGRYSSSDGIGGPSSTASSGLGLFYFFFFLVRFSSRNPGMEHTFLCLLQNPFRRPFLLPHASPAQWLSSNQPIIKTHCAALNVRHSSGQLLSLLRGGFWL